MPRTTRSARSSRTVTTSSWRGRTWRRSSPVPDGDDRQPADDPFTSVLVGFAHELRRAGLTVGTGDVLTYFAAMTPLNPSDLVDLYWAGRATLVSRREDISVYDQVFRRYFLGQDASASGPLELNLRTVSQSEAPLVMPSVDPGD